MFENSNYKDPNKKTIGVPRALYNYNLFPALNSFFRELGYNVLLSQDSSGETIERAQAHAQTEVCFPVKLAIGHVVELVEEGTDYLLVPSVNPLMSI